MDLDRTIADPWNRYCSAGGTDTAVQGEVIHQAALGVDKGNIQGENPEESDLFCSLSLISV